MRRQKSQLMHGETRRGFNQLVRSVAEATKATIKGKTRRLQVSILAYGWPRLRQHAGSRADSAWSLTILQRMQWAALKIGVHRLKLISGARKS
jgi:hypothetical protein